MPVEFSRVFSNTTVLDCKEIQPVNPKGNQFWIFIGRTDAEAETPNTLATWCKEPTRLKRPWCWERLKVGEEDNRGWHGWMASLTQWLVVWEGSGSWWWTGKPDVLQSMGLQSLTPLSDWTELSSSTSPFLPLKTQSNRILGNPLGHKQLCTPSHCCWVWANTWPKLCQSDSPSNSWEQTGRNPDYLKSETYKFRWGGAIYGDK